MASGCATAICNPEINAQNNRLIGTTFDNAGNTTVDASGQTFVYDAENKQIQVSNSSGIVGQYFYDGDGKRVKKIVPASGETTIFVYDAAGKMVAEYSTVTAETPQISYLTNDILGSPRITTDANGALISRRDFMPFGEEIARAGYGTDAVRQKFTAYERDDESNLDFAQARYYNKNLGRFNSADQIMLTPERIINPQLINLYQYVGNNPLAYTDPNGMIPVRLGQHTAEQIDQRLGVIAQTIDEISNQSGKEWDSQRRELEEEARNLRIEKEGNAVIGAWLDALKSSGENNGMQLSDFVLTTEPEKDLADAARAAGKSEATINNERQYWKTTDLVGTVIGGQIYLLQSSDPYQQTNKGGVKGTAVGDISKDDVSRYAGSYLRHEKYHRDISDSEYNAYSMQEKVLDNINKSNSPFKNQMFFNEMKKGIQQVIEINKKIEGIK